MEEMRASPQCRFLINGPFFAFNDAPNTSAPLGTCREQGTFYYPRPGRFNGWWVQLISNLVHSTPQNACATGKPICFRDVIRVRSTYYQVNPPAPPPAVTPGPCKNARGIGNKGCELCATSDHSM